MPVGSQSVVSLNIITPARRNGPTKPAGPLHATPGSYIPRLQCGLDFCWTIAVDVVMIVFDCYRLAWEPTGASVPHQPTITAENWLFVFFDNCLSENGLPSNMYCRR